MSAARISLGLAGTTATDRMKGAEAGVAPGELQDARPGDMSKVGEARSAAYMWRNVIPCTCSVTISAKKGMVFDKSHCPRHGKAAKA